MKKKNRRIACLFGLTAALAAGCTVSFEPARVYVPPPQAVVTVGMPDSYVWDGVEYVGVVGDQYMYLGPEGVWLVCDPSVSAAFTGGKGVIQIGAGRLFATSDRTCAGERRRGGKKETTTGGSPKNWRHGATVLLQ